MKSEKNSVEGQLDIFEAMNRAAAAVDKMVEEEQEARRKKSRGKTGRPMRQEDEPTEEETLAESAVTAESVIFGCDMHASMQKTFVNTGDDDFATVAYIDYNMIYWKDWNSPASLRRFAFAREAVDFYFEQLDKLKQCAFAQPAENEPFCNVKYVVENVYVECED